MKYRRLGSSDLNVSVIGLGTWALGGDSYGVTDDRVSVAAIRAAVDAGINLIDTAAVYGRGHSEEVVGEALKDLEREKIILATKCGNMRTPEGGYVRDGRAQSIRKGFEESLLRLRQDYVDLLQVHWPDVNTPLEETFTELARLKEEGKVRHIGVSNFSIQQMEEAKKYCPLVSLQPPYSLLDRAFEDGLQSYCEKTNLGVLSYGSIGAGVLTGKFTEKPVFPQGDTRNRFYAKFFTEEVWPKTAALVDVLRDIAASRHVETVEAAINWVLYQPAVTTALVGCKTPAQAEMNAKAADWEMTAEENARIEEAYQKIFA